MGALHELLGPAAREFQSLGTASQVGVAVAVFVVLSVVLNVLNQILFKNPNEPPVVFHWFPIIGSTVTYGMDPPTFFHTMRAKVRTRCPFGGTGDFEC